MILAAIFLFRIVASTQIPVEYFVGHKKSTVDFMFFKYFKNKAGHASKFLFFNRNRTSIDYSQTETTNLPQFGCTEAISYNNKRLKGFAPVFVVSVLNQGVFPKLGIQYAKINNNLTVFSWLVAEMATLGHVDLFLLARYTPRFSEHIDLFFQLELLQTFPTCIENNFSFTQRFRIGLKLKEFQVGLGLDLFQTGRKYFTKTENLGAFLRHEF